MGKKVAGPAAPDHLTMDLFAPGMSALHRAGLGGLACTLKAMERHHRNGLLRADKLPGPVVDGKYPWEVTARTVTLRFGEPEAAGEYLRKLFAFAFQIRDGVIHLPGQYPDPPPSLAVRAELQNALSRTLLQATKKNARYEPTVPYFIDPDDSGTGLIRIGYQRCHEFNHQCEWSSLVEKRTSRLLSQPKATTISGYLPGAIVRHSAPGIGSKSAIEDSIERLMCAVFGLVGCLALNLPDSQGLLLIPSISDLKEFCTDRPVLTPGTVAEVKVGGAGDAVLQAQLRMRMRGFLIETTIPACSALRFDERTWTKPQKARVYALTTERVHAARVEPSHLDGDALSLKRFEIALAELPPHIQHRTVKQTTGTGRGKRTEERDEYFLADSIVRPVIADNLATGRRWYHNFADFYRDKDSRKKLGYEIRGLRAMAKNRTLTDDQEAMFIAAVHRAIYRARGRIYAETMGRAAVEQRAPANPTTQKRWDKFMEMIRLGLVGSKTSTHVQDVINKLLSRNGTLPELRDREAAELIRRAVFDVDWQRVRNLALFALASYVRPAQLEAIAGDPLESSTPDIAAPETD